MKIEIKADIQKLFGPTLFRVTLPKDILQKLTDITDGLIVDGNRKTAGPFLAGQIKEEVQIDIKLLKENNIYDYFLEYLKAYVHYCLNDLDKFDSENHEIHCVLNNMWFNEMQPGGEYNPIHYHPGCHVSSTLYLKIPSNRPKRDIKYKLDNDGRIEWIDRSISPDLLQRATTHATPKVGEMYIWPSSMLHCVYPFLGDEVRRSIAWNGSYRLVDKRNNTLILGGTTWPEN